MSLTLILSPANNTHPTYLVSSLTSSLTSLVLTIPNRTRLLHFIIGTTLNIIYVLGSMNKVRITRTLILSEVIGEESEVSEGTTYTQTSVLQG